MKLYRLLFPVLLLFTFCPFAFAESDPVQSGWTVCVSIADQRTFIYEDSVLKRILICSTGIPNTDNATPIGDYVLNESGAKRGKWFFSEGCGEGAKYWVGFIGGTYLFHSLPMDRDGNIIPAEAEKLGQPASHGCIRLSVDNARWFYETVPDGALVHICESWSPGRADANAAVRTKDDVSAFLSAHMNEFKQKYMLSCEIALIRLSLALMGVQNLSEDAILDSIPQNGDDPERFFVCDNISAGRKKADGSIHWNNYGTHPPVVTSTLSLFMQDYDVSPSWSVRELHADDTQLASIIRNDSSFRGAIVWLVGHPERWGTKPEVNERGMVAGEHVRFVEPVMTADDRFRICDPESGARIESETAGVGRELFSYRIVGLFRKQNTPSSSQGDRISKGAPAAESNSGRLFRLGEAIRSYIAPGVGTRGLLVLCLIAVGYGVLHALGPGHQKTLITGYLLSEGGGIPRVLSVAGIASLSHAASVIILFGVLMLLGTGFGTMNVTEARTLVMRISGILLILLALRMIWQRIASFRSAVSGKSGSDTHCSCDVIHPAHRHELIPLIISGSVAPCPGAAFFLLYGFSADNPLAGVLAVLAISLGMWGTLIVIGLVTILARNATLAQTEKGGKPHTFIFQHIFGIGGSLLILLFAVLMTVSAYNVSL